MLADAARRLGEIAQVGTPVRGRGRSYRNENYVGIIDCARIVAAKTEIRLSLGHKFRQVGLIDGRLARSQRSNLLLIGIDTGYLMSQVRQTYTRGQTYISSADNRYVHPSNSP